MPGWVIALGLAGLAGFGLVFWVVILAESIAFHRGHHTVHAERDDARACGDAMVSVIVPANNEAGVIEGCLRSLLGQTHTRLELIVVDDRSTDDTLAIARRVATEDGRVRVLHVETLPPGWTGKTHALHCGSATATGTWLLFTDADTIHEPGCLAACVRRATQQHVALLSGWPALAPRAPVSATLDTMCGAVLASWYRKRGHGAPHRFAAFANGQFLLIRADAYRAVGGHQAVRERLLEDLALAELFFARGRLFEVVLLHKLVRVRTYTTVGESLRGWWRIFLVAAHGNVGRLLRRAAALPVIGLAGYLAVGGALAFGSSDPRLPWMLVTGTGAAEIVAMTLAVALVCHHANVPRRYALLAPVLALLTAVALAAAARSIRRGHSVEWHGVQYSSLAAWD